MTYNNCYSITDSAFEIGSFAIQAMLYEVSCFPSPGLVSPVSNGAHRDMNFYSFLDSTVALNKYFSIFAQEGMSGKGSREIFSGIRQLGELAEKEMFAKTGGVNTHKGMLFLMGISCAAVGRALYTKVAFADIPKIIKEMTAGIVAKELKVLKEEASLSNGERLFLKYQSKGIRGEVEAGIPTVFNYGLEVYRNSEELSQNDRLIHTLISIMQICEDTTILHRHSPDVLVAVKARAKDIMAAGGMKSNEGRQQVQLLSQEFIERNISPGGSADLLGVTVFFYLVEAYMKKTT